MVNSWGEQIDEGHSRPRHEHFRYEKNETRRCESDHPAADARLGHKRRRQPHERQPAIRLGASRMRLGAWVEHPPERQKRSDCSIRAAAQSVMRRCATHDLKSKKGGDAAKSRRRPPTGRCARKLMRPTAAASAGASLPQPLTPQGAVTMPGGELERRRRKHSLSFA